VNECQVLLLITVRVIILCFDAVPSDLPCRINHKILGIIFLAHPLAISRNTSKKTVSANNGEASCWVRSPPRPRVEPCNLWLRAELLIEWRVKSRECQTLSLLSSCIVCRTLGLWKYVFIYYINNYILHKRERTVIQYGLDAKSHDRKTSV
jgi:hypothetical protein